jgi:hypothetical protein
MLSNIQVHHFFAAVIKAPGSTVITAVVVRDQKQFTNCFEIYTITANYDGQKALNMTRLRVTHFIYAASFPLDVRAGSYHVLVATVKMKAAS